MQEQSALDHSRSGGSLPQVLKLLAFCVYNNSYKDEDRIENGTLLSELEGKKSKLVPISVPVWGVGFSLSHMHVVSTYSHW